MNNEYRLVKRQEFWGKSREKISWNVEEKIGGEIEGEGATVTVTLALQSLHHTPGRGVPLPGIGVVF